MNEYFRSVGKELSDKIMQVKKQLEPPMDQKPTFIFPTKLL